MQTKFGRAIALAGVAVALASCTTGNAGVEPTVTGVNPTTSNRLQLGVGTANINGTAGLNVVATFRQAGGGTAVLLNTPTLSGPFVVPAAAAGASNTDGGTNSLSGQAQVLGAATTTTFGQTGGVFGDGFAPANATTGGTANYPRASVNAAATGVVLSNVYALPLVPFAGVAALPYIGGPPTFPQVRGGTYPPGFVGYSQGFTDFGIIPAAGTYNLALSVPTSPTTSGVVSASATLASAALLPTLTAPTIALDGTGGGSVTLTVPAGVTEAYVNIVDLTGACYPSPAFVPAFYTVRFSGTGTQTLPLPGLLGPPAVTGSTSVPNRTICAGDKYLLDAVGFDYPAFAAAYPQSTSQTPTIVGSNGQADITTSKVVNGTSP